MRSLSVAAVLVLCCALARAAGGHFDVDDASMLDQGACQLESWWWRMPSAAATVVHLGPSCRIGPVEAGIVAERVGVAGVRRHQLGPQLKWVTEALVDQLSAGLVWSASYDLTNGGRPAQTLYAPFTWRAAETLWLHANVGTDRAVDGMRWRRQGVSVEWAASERFTVIVERIQIARDWTSRIGGRIGIDDTLSLDLSVARSGPQAERVYVVGLNQTFSR